MGRKKYVCSERAGYCSFWTLFLYCDLCGNVQNKSEEAHALAGLSFFVLFASRAGLLLLAEWKELMGLGSCEGLGGVEERDPGVKILHMCVC